MSDCNQCILSACIYLIVYNKQSGHTALPQTIVARRLKVFLEDDLEQLFPSANHMRVIAHPTRLLHSVQSATDTNSDTDAMQSNDSTTCSQIAKRISQLTLPQHMCPKDARIVIAVGQRGAGMTRMN
jgi:hypothetical protein